MTSLEMTRIVEEAADAYRRESGDAPQLHVQSVRQEGGWFYVAVTAEPKPERIYPYYDHLAQVERRVREGRDVDVLLVPARAA